MRLLQYTILIVPIYLCSLSCPEKRWILSSHREERRKVYFCRKWRQKIKKKLDHIYILNIPDSLSNIIIIIFYKYCGVCSANEETCNYQIPLVHEWYQSLASCRIGLEVLLVPRMRHPGCKNQIHHHPYAWIPS